MKYFALFALNFLCVCQKSSEHTQPEKSFLPENTITPVSPKTDASSSAVSEIIPLPKDYRSCKSKDDCIVVDTLYGLTSLPKAGDTCQAKCTFGIAKHAFEQWELIRSQVSPIPCDIEMEACPPIEQWYPLCIQNRCESAYKTEN